MLRYANRLAPYWKFKRQSINLNRWTIGASIEKLRKDEGLATHARARRRRWPGRAVAVAVVCGRSDLGLNIPFKWLRILPGVMTVRFVFSRW
jgi:hypothetical protein